jgi:hypothetical protein
VGAAIGELEVIQEQVHSYRIPPVEEICQFCQAVKWNGETTNNCCLSGKVVLAPLHDSPQDFKQFWRLIVFSQGYILQQHIWIYVHECIVCGKCID